MNLIAKGNTAEIFEYGDKSICKLFIEGFPERAIHEEYNNALLMSKFKLPVPRCLDVINIDNRRGIVYERLYGKTLLEYYFDTGSYDFLLDTMVSLQGEILKCHTNEGKSYKAFLLQLSKGEENHELHKRILELPEGDHLCHGDFHPLNIIVEGVNKVTIIDFMNLCYGPWQYDVARSYFLLTSGDIPLDIPNREELIRVKNQLAEDYLERMKVSYEEIERFINVIALCRKYE